jgi:hypothetical protein
MLQKTGATMAREKYFKVKATPEETICWVAAAKALGTSASAVARAELDRLKRRAERVAPDEFHRRVAEKQEAGE